MQCKYILTMHIRHHYKTRNSSFFIDAALSVSGTDLGSEASRICDNSSCLTIVDGGHPFSNSNLTLLFRIQTALCHATNTVGNDCFLQNSIFFDDNAVKVNIVLDIVECCGLLEFAVAYLIYLFYLQVGNWKKVQLGRIESNGEKYSLFEFQSYFAN